jgi:hypothetical protein
MRLSASATVRSCPLPPGALLARYVESGAYTDCYCTELARHVSHAEYVEAFYTSGLFRIERYLLRLFLSRPSTDAQVHELATGEADHFAAWRVEGRAPDQLLLCDLGGRTRSWLMVTSAPAGSAPATRLYFGSAVVPIANSPSGQRGMGILFRSLLGFHKLYSRALLGAAGSRLARAAR